MTCVSAFYGTAIYGVSKYGLICGEILYGKVPTINYDNNVVDVSSLYSVSDCALYPYLELVDCTPYKPKILNTNSVISIPISNESNNLVEIPKLFNIGNISVIKPIRKVNDLISSPNMYSDIQGVNTSDLTKSDELVDKPEINNNIINKPKTNKNNKIPYKPDIHDNKGGI